MNGSQERALLIAVGLSLIVYALNGPISNALQKFEEKKAVNCVNVALKSIDLAIVNSLGGGSAEGYVYLPCSVFYRGRVGGVDVSSGNITASIPYPFEIRGMGEASGYGKFVATWRGDYMSVGWVRGWRKG